MNNTNGRSTPLHLSDQAVLHWPYKLVTGKQVYSRWTGELYPNCSTVNGLHTDHGPNFEDFKVLDSHIRWAFSEEKADQLLWTQNCQEGCLFNVEDDPREERDLAKDPAHEFLLHRLQLSLKSLNNNTFNPERGESSVG